MRRIHQGHFTDLSGNAVSNGSVTVYLAGTNTLATVYSTLTSTTSSNSVTSDSTGKYIFYVDIANHDSDQTFKIVLSKSGFLSQTYDDVSPTPVLGTYAISVNTTYTTNVIVPKGVVFSDNGGTLTFNGPFEAGLYQVFSGFSAGDVTGLKQAYPEWWGGAGNGSTNNYSAITAGLAATKKVRLLNGVYNTGSPIVLTHGNILEGNCVGADDSHNCSRLHNTGVGDAIQINGVFKATVKNLQITGSVASRYGIYLHNDIYTLIENVVLGDYNTAALGHGNHALYLDNASYYDTINNLIIRKGYGDGIHIDGSAVGGSSVNSVTITRYDIGEVAGKGIYTKTCQDIHLRDGNVASNTGYGIHLDTNAYRVVFDGLLYDSNGVSNTILVDPGAIYAQCALRNTSGSVLLINMNSGNSHLLDNVFANTITWGATTTYGVMNNVNATATIVDNGVYTTRYGLNLAINDRASDLALTKHQSIRFISVTGNTTIKLPPALTYVDQITIAKADAGGTTVTIAVADGSGNTIVGTSTIAVQGTQVTCWSDAYTKWYCQ